MFYKRLGLSCFLALALVPGPFFIGVSVAQTAQLSENLEPGKPVGRELKGGEKHTYPILLKANDFLKLVITQKGIDVVARLVGPDGKVGKEVNTPYWGNQGEELLSSIIENEGNYLLEIESLDNTAPSGKYELSLKAIRSATEQDQAEVEIEKLIAKARELYQIGKLDQSLLIAREAVEKSEQVFGPEHPVLATSLHYLARCYAGKGDNQNAEPLFQRALTIREKALGPDHPDVAQTLNNLAMICLEKGDYQKGERLFQQVLAIREKALGPNHQDVGATLFGLAELYRAQNDYDRLEPLYQRVQAIWEKALGPNHPYTTMNLTSLALLYQRRGDYQKAETCFQRVLAIREKTLGPDHWDLAETLTNLAALYLVKGDYQKAEPLFQRGLAMREKTQGPDHPGVALGLTGLAMLYRYKGDYQKAEQLNQRALAIREKTLGPDHPDVALSLNNLGELYRIKDGYQKAESLFQRALVIREKTLGPDHLDVAVTLDGLASVYLDMNDYQKAEAFFQRELAIWEKAVGPDHPGVAISLNNLAELYRSKGDQPKAELFFQRALSILEKAMGSDHPHVALLLNNLAQLYRARGDISQAIQFQARANETSERDLLRNLATGSEQQKALYLNQTSRYTDQTLSLHLQSAPQSVEAQRAALAVVLRRKGRGLDAMISALETLRSQQIPEIQKLMDEYASLAGQISALALRGPEKQTPEEYVASLKALETQSDKLEADISAKSLELKTQFTPITVENIQKQIPADGVLVEFVSYQPYEPKIDQFGTPRLAVYTLNQSGEIKWADLGEAGPIEQAVAVFRQVVGKPKADLAKDITPAAQVLYKLVMKPVRALAGKNRHLLISPDGVLNLFPFAALMDEQGNFLVETYTLTYLTSGRDLLRLAVKIDSLEPPLVLADPEYLEGVGPQMMGRSLGRLARLIGTRLEGEQLKAIFPDARLKTKTEATEKELKQVNRPALVHIATHGCFLEDAPQTSEKNIPVHARDMENSPIHFDKEREANPLLRSMLFFAGANHGGSEDNDGIMTALEAAQLNLWGTKLVTLSACNTGLGDVKNGDGVYGLRRALVLAGSESQMISLWSVSDQATRELMVDYYTRLK
ncbi:MAG: tetratricopeptide repeat protein, partial [Acidobacteria bacterium]|nr:tetratricopeptide repeat protein [Acidobacteriota bacterium]